MIIAIGVISRELVQCGSIQYLRVAGDHLIMGSPLSIWCTGIPFFLSVCVAAAEFSLAMVRLRRCDKVVNVVNLTPLRRSEQVPR